VITTTLVYLGAVYTLQKEHLRTLQEEQFHLTMIIKGKTVDAEVEHLKNSLELLESTDSYLERCDNLPKLAGFEVNETFLQTIVTILGTSVATGLSYIATS